MIKKIKSYIKLVRVRQWYKNLVVFLALIFSFNLLYPSYLINVVLSFFAVSFMASASYIVNDLKDIAKDKLHPEKCKRPLASGAVTRIEGVILFVLAITGSLSIGFNLGANVMLLLGSFFVFNLLYTFVLKRIMFADILTISSLFVLRAIIGAYAISVYISPWLILCPFFLALFLAVAKRRSDLTLLKRNHGEEHIKSKGILTGYDLNVTNSLMNISTTLLIISYSLYCFLSDNEILMVTIPFALFVIFGYYKLVLENSDIVRQPDKIIKSPSLLIGALLWFGITVLLLYL